MNGVLPAQHEPTPIRWRNLPRWLRETRRLDRRLYRAAPRPTTARRLLRSAFPNLRRPIFVVGAPRSGTSFLGDCIGALPEVSYHYEPPVTKAAARYVYERTWSRRRARFFYRRVVAWLMRMHLDGDLRFADKTPQNSFIIDFLNDAFDGAQFVHIVRDGRDAALSYSRKPWLAAAADGSGRRESGGYPLGAVPRFWVEPHRRAEFVATTDLHRCAWAWRRFTEAALEAGRSLPQDRYHELRYERLVTGAPAAGDLLLDFLGIDAPESRRRFHAALAAARPDSIGGWRDDTNGIRSLGDGALDLVHREAGDLLALLGYATT